jgi:hypothetical protein
MNRIYNLPNVVILAATTSVSVVFTLLLPISLSIDSYAYISNSSSVRPHGYDLIIDLLSGPENKYIFNVVAFQLIITSILPLIVYNTFKFYSTKLAFIVTLLILINPYQYFMALQIMSESIYIFILVLTFCLIIRLYEKFNVYLALSIATLVVIGTEIRPTTIFLLILFVFASFRNIKSLNLSLLFQRAIFPLLILVFLSVKPHYTENNSSNNFPYFIWHFMMQCEFLEGSEKRGCLSNNTDSYTESLRSLVFQNLKTNSNFYNLMASEYGVRGEILKIRTEYWPPSDANLIKLTNSLIFDKQSNMHIGANFVSELWKIHGRQEISSLLNKVILMTIIQNPEGFFDFYIGKLYTSILTQNPVYIHDLTYWWFIPEEPSQLYLVESFPLRSEAYAAWVKNLDKKTGNNVSVKSGGGSEILSSTYSVESIINSIKLRDLTIIPLNYGQIIESTYSKILILLSPLIIMYWLNSIYLSLFVYLLIFFGILFYIRNGVKNKSHFSFTLISFVSAWALVYSAVISGMTTRHIIMNLNLLILVYATFFIREEPEDKGLNL